MCLKQVVTSPSVSFDPEGLIFAVGIDSQQVRLYDLRSFDKVLKAKYYCLGIFHFSLFFF